MVDYKSAKIGDMVGLTFVTVERVVRAFPDHYSDEGDCLVFTLSGGDAFVFGHWQDCCETVAIEDVAGDLADLAGSPLLFAEEAEKCEDNTDHGGDSKTWTFYKFATVKGDVTVRWLGESNGYYSESVDLYRYPAASDES